MRKLIPILTLVALVGAFLAYFAMQGKYGITANASKGPDAFATTQRDTGTVIKPGSGAWSKQYDKDGNLYYQFKCDFYDPQPDGTVKVTHPLIQFFLSGGQLLQIEGADGTIRFAQGADKGMLNNSPTDPPRYGNLQHVTVKLYESAAAQNADDPEMTMKMRNAQFDDDTYRLFTEEFVDESGKVVHHDEVPVSVDARDYSFTGSGLELFWNDLDKQLKSLQIDHGTDLIVNSGSGLLPQDSTEQSTAAPAPPNASSTLVPQQAAPEQKASPEVLAAPLKQPDGSRQRYTATFFDNVRIEQGDEPLVEAQRMDVDFAPKEESGNRAKPPAPATSISAAGPATTSPAPSSSAASKPEPKEIHVKWTGIMKMVPTNLATAPPLPGGKAIVRLSGAPVKVRQLSADGTQRVDLRCHDLEYHTDDSSAHLQGDVLLTQGKINGPVSTITGDDLEFSRASHIAKFIGPGSTEFPDPNDLKSVLKSSWQQGCTVHLYDTAGNQSQIESADLVGNVTVDDEPRLHLSADKNLLLRFDRLEGTDASQNTTPPLRLISANGNAQCIVHEANEQTRQIRGEHLQLFRDRDSSGKLYARTIECDGDVQANTEDQSLSADGLQIDLVPAKPGAKPKRASNDSTEELGAGDVALDRLIATNNVVITGKDGAAASADRLVVQMVEDQPHVQLDGSARKPAVVRNRTSTITGPTIRLSPHEQIAEIDGAGTFDGEQEPQTPLEKARPVKLAWSKSATLDGKANRVTLDGQVAVASEDPTGSHQTAACDRIIATLLDVAPTTRPAPKNEAKESYTDGADFMRNKQIELVSLVAGEQTPTTQPIADVKSSLADADGNILKQFEMATHNSIDYNVQTRRVSVVGPGSISAYEKSATTKPSPQDEPSGIGGQGNTQIGWRQRFLYDDVHGTAVIAGDVTVIHNGDGPKSESLILSHADIIQAEFETNVNSAPEPNGEPATPDLKQVTATGIMTIRTADKTIRCGEIDFDPVQQLLTCTGGALGRVTIVDDFNLDSGSCSEAVFNMKTNQLKKLTDVTGQGR